VSPNDPIGGLLDAIAHKWLSEFCARLLSGLRGKSVHGTLYVYGFGIFLSLPVVSFGAAIGGERAAIRVAPLAGAFALLAMYFVRVLAKYFVSKASSDLNAKLADFVATQHRERELIHSEVQSLETEWRRHREATPSEAIPREAAAESTQSVGHLAPILAPRMIWPQLRLSRKRGFPIGRKPPRFVAKLTLASRLLVVEKLEDRTLLSSGTGLENLPLDLGISSKIIENVINEILVSDGPGDAGLEGVADPLTESK
jgi:hypothetical protein